MKSRARDFLIVTVIIVGGFTACEVNWRTRHPAPLGRSVEQVTERLRRAIPLGTPKDSVIRYFAAMGVPAMPSDSVSLMVYEHNAVPPRPLPASITIRMSFDAMQKLTMTQVEERINAM